MPRRKERFDLEKITVKLFKGEFQALMDLYPKVGANRIIRELVHRQIVLAKEQAQQALQNLPIIEIGDEDEPESSGAVSERPRTVNEI